MKPVLLQNTARPKKASGNGSTRPKIKTSVLGTAEQNLEIKSNQTSVKSIKRIGRVVNNVRGIGRRPDSYSAKASAAALGAPIGNDNYLRGKLWRQAIINALEKRGRGERLKALEDIAGKLISLALSKSMPAIRELGDRVDGKPAQMLVGDPDNPLQFNDQTQLTNSTRVTRLLQVLALQDPASNGASAFAALKNKAVAKKSRPSIVKKK